MRPSWWRVALPPVSGASFPAGGGGGARGAPCWCCSGSWTSRVLPGARISSRLEAPAVQFTARPAGLGRSRKPRAVPSLRASHPSPTCRLWSRPLLPPPTWTYSRGWCCSCPGVPCRLRGSLTAGKPRLGWATWASLRKATRAGREDREGGHARGFLPPVGIETRWGGAPCPG